MKWVRYYMIHSAYVVLHMIERGLSWMSFWIDSWCRPGRLFHWLQHQMAMHLTISLAARSDSARRRAKGEWPEGSP
jgi:hypothetical protein